MTGFARPLRLAIVGGGFTGVALATHALTSATQPLSVDVIEPSAKLGRGAAYGTTNADHRINVPSDRMSLFGSDPTHFTRWLFDNKWLPDPESADPLYGVDPNQVPDFIALRGDPSDKLPGAAGVGPKRAAQLVQRYRTLSGVLEAGLFKTQAEMLRRYRLIATMDAKAPLPLLADQQPTWGSAATFARDWGLNQLADRLAGMA
jgi:FAD-NAD(P)-binding/5'-3' exonuclease, C-terminal SAM fold